MFKKAKRVNFRRRNESDEEEKEEEKQSPPPQLLQEQPQPCGADDEPSVRCAVINNPEIIAHFNVSTDMNHGNGFQTNTTRMNLKEKKKSKENKDVPKASLLSFHDEEDDIEVFKVKKSNYNKKIVKQLKKEYKEDLEKAGGSKQDPSTAGELTTVMMSVKEEPMTEESVANSDKGEEEMEVDSNNESDVDQKSNPAGAFSNALSSLNTLRPGEIPDAAFIHAARKRRQLARELGDNVPPENEPGGNRLVREDENDASDDEDDDEKRRIIFSVKEKTQRQKIAEEIGIEGSDDEALDAGDQDEELNRWEQEQIRKGISIPQVQASQQADVNMYYQSTYEAASYVSSYGLPYSYSSYGSDVSKPVKSENSVTYTAPSNGMMPITTDLVKKRLKDR